MDRPKLQDAVSQLARLKFTLALYKQESKKDAPPNSQDPEWVHWRADKITAFVTQLNKAVKQRKPNAIFSVSPNPYFTSWGQLLSGARLNGTFPIQMY
jgi:uncharacterized lipoprotein YddW (UPF0748 family)